MLRPSGWAESAFEVFDLPGHVRVEHFPELFWRPSRDVLEGNHRRCLQAETEFLAVVARDRRKPDIFALRLLRQSLIDRTPTQLFAGVRPYILPKAPLSAHMPQSRCAP